MGIVYLVGAGPGDPDLITLKALRLVRTCDALVHDALIPEQLINEASKECKIFDVGKRAGCKSFLQSDINDLLLKLALQGKKVVRLKGGDPFVFSRGGEEVAFLDKHDIKTQIIPGITSGIAAPTYFGIPVTHRDGASSTTFVTGHEQTNKKETNVNWRLLAKSTDSIVIYMGIRNIEFIVEELILGGLAEATPCAIVQEATLKSQQCSISKLSTLVNTIRENDFSPPSIIIIGKIVNFQAQNVINELSSVNFKDIKQV